MQNVVNSDVLQIPANGRVLIQLVMLLPIYEVIKVTHFHELLTYAYTVSKWGILCMSLHTLGLTMIYIWNVIERKDLKVIEVTWF